MSSPKKLDSPIQLAHRRRTAVFETPLPSIPVEMAVTQRDSIKHGSPYDQLDRLFVGLHPSWNGIDAIEFKDGSPVGFVSHYSPQGKDIPLQRLTQVTHPSFLAYKEIFISQGDVYFLYEQWGVTLEQVWKLSPVFRLGEAEVAIICKKILQGLLYIHKELNIFYGDLKCSDVIITHGGEVKIVGIGSKLFQKPGLLGKNRDVQDVCNIARLLLQQGESCGPVRFLAEDFIGVPPTSTAEALLEHPFLQTTAPSWCLKPVPMLYAIAREKQVL
ncbi:uncharacterized protein BDW70DRAFT_145057 [Aspergillus foveolatus]|uniref:uncharacterized protein n=1 Tax=Aspergillus foveolatus TaxID=210207 RepID=UPI003CCCD0C4